MDLVEVMMGLIVIFWVSEGLGLGLDLVEGKLAQITIMMMIIATIIPNHFHYNNLDFKKGNLEVIDDVTIISCSNKE